ncbi:ADP-ribosylation factor-like protein 2-binding protein [Eurytemora carolleeae]|uniref:ADP-ribosylation factor-like protein 2-binding protein n=1 Tax=Eurytemora carolleeae TaxID=1294199 RepID=UPI000C788555|nr:ADP-ribosylation factor-like protein 2-binding protein [Eurytemora carolleeae]|eukprot:XP_023324719.1 ADP-ribosylation factor-like protein 2-binding protein [Eurytemora affinis]
MSDEQGEHSENGGKQHQHAQQESSQKSFSGGNGVHEPLAISSEDEEEIFDIHHSQEEFDHIVGEIENILVEDDFLKLQSNLLEKHWHHFEDTEENKLIYTDIFHEYTEAMEKYIETQLEKRVDGFTMDDFLETVQAKRQHLDGDVFDLLYTLSDFMAFKDLYVEFAKDKGSPGPDLSDLLSVQKIN